MESRFIIICLVLVLIKCTLISADARSPAERRAALERWRREHCTNCTVKGKEYKGHSRFRYDEGCNRFRCICRCNGSWECPAEQTINLCERRAAARRRNRGSTAAERGSGRGSRRTSSSRRQCQTCKVNGKEHPGHALFRRVDGCIQYTCICHCNGTWACPASRAKNTCGDGATSTRSESEGRTESESSSRRSNNGDGRRNQYAGCQNCTAFGKSFKGNSHFHANQGCVNYTRCVCHCNGSWDCPGRFAENICKDRDSSSKSPTQSNCNTCPVKGKTFPGGRNFNHTDGCIEYKECVCYCNGSWVCPGSRARNICIDEGKESEVNKSSSHVSGLTSGCRECVAKGRTFASNSLFDLKDKCMEYRNCECHCNGSWACPPSHARNTCVDDGDEQSTSCKTCEVYGKTFEGNRNFTISRGCWEYRNCLCHCNGSWVCPGTSKKYVCDTERDEEKKPDDKDSGSTHTSTTTASECRTCQAYGKRFKNQYFDVTNGCLEYRRCICRCDGSWECKGQHARNICDARQTSRSNNTEPERECSACSARGKEVLGNSSFSLREGCWEYTNCKCYCNGSWECPSQSAVDVCTRDNQQSREEECVKCDAKGKIVAGGTEFDLTNGCYHYTSCKCNCDGSWECPAENGRDICSDAGDSRDSSGCMMCKTTDGSFHRPNQPFQFVDDCIERNCDCYCNGSWSCPGDRSRWICTDRCRGCEVEGRQVLNNTVFKHRTGCLEYTCNCHCNGSWSCPGETVKNTCPVGVRNNCNKCKISDTEEYLGESDFVLKQGCLHYKCRCNCDGSYSCPAEDSRNVCYGEELGGCRSCVISENEIYQGETDFNLRRGCIASECRCYCNGTWHCPAEKNRNTCIGEVLGGCKVCQVEGNKTFRGNTEFDLRRECLHYKCKCNCDGSWNCPGEHTRNVCKGEVPGGCRSCVISEDEFYPGNSDFDMMKNCIHYKCRCNCDGSYNCPGGRARRVCAGSPNGKKAVTERPKQPQCRRCYISEREQFAGNTDFSLTEGCYKYMCSCRCDGSWECPAKRSVNICSSGSSSDSSSSRGRTDVVTSRPRQTQCRRCSISDEEQFDGNTDFSLTRGCYKFMCFCKCDGSWKCPAERTIDTCSSSSRSSSRNSSSRSSSSSSSSRSSSSSNRSNSSRIGSSRSSSSSGRSSSSSRSSRKEAVTERPTWTQCRRCRVSDRQHFEGGKDFSIEQGCYKYMCSCSCNGSWKCPSERVVNICESKSRGSTTERRTSSHCKVCTRNGRQYRAGSEYNITRGCQQFHCTCQCDGSSDCDLNNPTYICSTRRRGPYETSTRGRTRVNAHRAQTPQSNRRKRCRPCNVIGQQVNINQDFHLEHGCTIYKNCECRCNGQWQCADKEKICDDTGRQTNGRVVFKFEGATSSSTPSSSSLPTASRGYSNQQNQRGSTGSRTVETSAWVYADGEDSSYVTVKDNDKTGGGYKIEVQTKYVPTYNYGNGRRAGQLQESKSSRVYTASGSTPGKDRFLQHQVKTPESSESSGHGISRCNKCIADKKYYPAGAHFDWRRGCVVYKCHCLCSGSYRCRPTSDYDCTAEKEQITCRNCIYQGMIYPGNMGFTVRDGCLETKCSCHCNGTHTCQSSRRSPGCHSAAKTSNQGRVYDPTRHGYVRRTAGRVYTHCPSCGLGKPVVQHTPASRDYEADTTRTGDHSSAGDSGAGCSGCDVEGNNRVGNTTFSFQKDCVEFDCYCSCGGSWKCAGRPLNCTPGTEVAPGSKNTFSSNQEPERLVRDSSVDRHGISTRDGYIADQSRATDSSEVGQVVTKLAKRTKTRTRPDSLDSVDVHGCTDCYVDETRVRTLSTFVRQVGCVQTVCQCTCAGHHVCPSRSSINVCRLKDKKPLAERKGCISGNKLWRTRVFPLVDKNCIQRTCICHDDGTHTCKHNIDDIKVC